MRASIPPLTLRWYGGSGERPAQPDPSEPQDGLQRAHRAAAAEHGRRGRAGERPAGGRPEQTQLVEDADHRRPGRPIAAVGDLHRDPEPGLQRHRAVQGLGAFLRHDVRRRLHDRGVEAMTAADQVRLGAHRGDGRGHRGPERALPIGIGQSRVHRGDRAQRHAVHGHAAAIDPDRGVIEPGKLPNGREHAPLERMRARPVRRRVPAAARAGEQHPRVLAGAVVEHGRRLAHPRCARRVARSRRRRAQVVLGQPAATQDVADGADVHRLTVVGGAHDRDQPVGHASVLADRGERHARLDGLRAGPDEREAFGIAERCDEPAGGVADRDVAEVDGFLEPGADDADERLGRAHRRPLSARRGSGRPCSGASVRPAGRPARRSRRAGPPRRRAPRWRATRSPTRARCR